MKTKELKVEGITREDINALADHWDRFKSCYFWSPPGSASGRRNEEKRHYREVEFTVNGEYALCKIEVSCSCKNYYCTREMWAEGKKQVQGGRYLRKLLEKGTFVSAE